MFYRDADLFVDFDFIRTTHFQTRATSWPDDGKFNLSFCGVGAEKFSLIGTQILFTQFLIYLDDAMRFQIQFHRSWMIYLQ